MSIARKILKSTFAQVAGKAITALLAVLVVKILSNYLSKSGYGDYGTVYEFLAFFGAMADLGIFTIAVREMSSSKNSEKIFQNSLTLRTLTTTIAMSLGVIVAFLITRYQGTYIPYGIAIASIATWLVILSGTLSIALQARLKMEYQAIALVLGKILTVGAIITIVNTHPIATKQSFYLLLWAGVAGSFLTFLLTYIFARKFINVRFRFNKNTCKDILKESVPFGLSLILNTIYFRLDTVLFSLILPRSIDGVCQSAYCADTEVGSYMVGVRMLEVLTLVPIFFMNSVLPVMTRHIREKSQKLKDIMNYSFYFLLAIGSAGAVGIAILARKITLLLSSKEFLTNDGVYGSDTAIQILMGAMFLCYLANFLGFSIIALGEQKKLLWINFWAVLFNLTSNLWVIPHYGLRGAATTSVISEFIIFTLCFITLKKISPEFTPKLTRVIKILFSSTVMGALVYFFQFSLLLSIGGGMLIFFALLYFTKAITPEMLLILKKK